MSSTQQEELSSSTLSSLKQTIHKSLQYLISLNNPQEKSTFTNVIQFSYLLVKLIDSMEHLIRKKVEEEEKEASSTVLKLQDVTSKLLQTVGVLGPVLSITLPNHPYAALMFVLGYNLNLFRKVLVVAENKLVASSFYSLIVPVLQRLHVPGSAKLVHSRL